MKKWILLGLLTLALCFGAAAAEETTILGKPFPEFTAVDNQGNTFTLSEQLKTHEAVLINIWATWCPPCKMEMPYLNEVYEAYKDRVAFIALSKEPNDTAEKIDAYIRDNGILFPMGRDENETLYRYCGGQGVPTTVIVDRFGNTGFLRVGSFFSVGEIKRVVEAFLGDGYTETVPLTEIPKDTATRMLPSAKTTRICVENGDARLVIFNIGNGAQTLEAYVIPGETAHLRLDAAVSDNPADLIFDDGFQSKAFFLREFFGIVEIRDLAMGRQNHRRCHNGTGKRTSPRFINSANELTAFFQILTLIQQHITFHKRPPLF